MSDHSVQLWVPASAREKLYGTGITLDRKQVVSSDGVSLACGKFSGMTPQQWKSFNQLLDMGVAYTLSYTNGLSGPKTQHLRFTATGEAVILDVLDSQLTIPVDLLVGLANRGPLVLAAHVKDHAKAITPLPWAGQEQYGKVYQAKRLYTPVDDLLSVSTAATNIPKKVPSLFE